MTKTEGIILKAVDQGELDRLLTIYTKEFGKIRVMARGIKKVESKLRYSLEPFSLSQLILVEGRNFKIVKNAVLVNEFASIRKDLKKIKVVYKIIELLDELIIGEEKDENIWDLLIQTFKIIEGSPTSFSVVFKKFREKLFELLGYDPKEVKTAEDIY